MRKVFISNLISLDNMISRPNGDLDWFMADQEFFDYTATQADRRDTILFGRVTYEGMESYWTSKEAAESDPVITGQMNSTHKLVFSRTLHQVKWRTRHSSKVIWSGKSPRSSSSRVRTLSSSAAAVSSRS